MSKWDYATYSPVRVVAAENIEADDPKEVLAGSDKLYILDSLGGLVNTMDAYNVSGLKNDEISFIGFINSTFTTFPLTIIATDKGSVIMAFKTKYNDSIRTYQIEQTFRHDFGEGIVSLKIVDLTGDGYEEVLVGTEDDYITALSGNGDFLWSFKANGDVTDEDFADINSDGRGEVVLGTISGTIYVISKEKGEFMWRYDLNEPISKIEVADLEGDPYKEVVVGTMTRMVYVFEVNQTFTDLQMAEDLYIQAQELYIVPEYNMSLDYLKRAQEFYRRANDPVGIRKTGEMIKTIEDKFSGLKKYQADMYYDKAQEYFVEGEYEQAKKYAEMSKKLYEEFRDTQNSLKAELLLMRIEKMIAETTKETSTTVYVAPEAPPKVNRKTTAYILLGIAFIILVAGLIIKKRRSAKAMERYMSDYEKELEKVIEGDLAELRDTRKEEKGGG
jgi:tetratricopeptide (TPR) repeat protein